MTLYCADGVTANWSSRPFTDAGTLPARWGFTPSVASPAVNTLGCVSTEPRTTAPETAQELALARKLGFAEDNDDHTEGISAVGFAFRDLAGEVFAISVPIPTSRFADRRNAVLAALLRVKADLALGLA